MTYLLKIYMLYIPHTQWFVNQKIFRKKPVVFTNNKKLP